MADTEKLHAWWSRLPDHVRDDLMDDPEQTLSERMIAAVTEAGGPVWVAGFTEADLVLGPHLTPATVAFVRGQAAEREAGLAP